MSEAVYNESPAFRALRLAVANLRQVEKMGENITPAIKDRTFVSEKVGMDTTAAAVRDYYAANGKSLAELFRYSLALAKITEGKDELAADMDKALRLGKYVENPGSLRLQIIKSGTKYTSSYNLHDDAQLVGGMTKERLETLESGIADDLSLLAEKYHCSPKVLVDLAKGFATLTGTEGKLGYETGEPLAKALGAVSEPSGPERAVYSLINTQLHRLLEPAMSWQHRHAHKNMVIPEAVHQVIAKVASDEGRDSNETLADCIASDVYDYSGAYSGRFVDGKRVTIAPNFFSNADDARQAENYRLRHETIEMRELADLSSCSGISVIIPAEHLDRRVPMPEAASQNPYSDKMVYAGLLGEALRINIEDRRGEIASATKDLGRSNPRLLTYLTVLAEAVSKGTDLPRPPEVRASGMQRSA